MKFRNLLTLMLASGLLINTAACDSDEETHDGDNDATLTIALNGLETLGGDFVYEGWLIIDGSPVTTGRFNVEAGTDSYDFTVTTVDAEAASTFVLTIEPGDAVDVPEPSDMHILAGDLTDGSADLTIGHAAALGTDLTSAAATFIFNTPTTGMVMDDFDQGIWWLAIGANGPEASMELPTLPSGWVYEGWVVGSDGPISTGRFTMAEGADDDGAGATAGPDGAPPFPGQDFINPAVMLDGYVAVISVEPADDDAATPFALKPLVAMGIDASAPGVSQPMANMAAGGPTGTVAIE